MAQYFDAPRGRRFYRPVLGLLGVLVVAGQVHAQVPAESAGGTRALGMAGAFTAVADDASATWWNPAGLSTLLADAVIDGGRLERVDESDAPLLGTGAWRSTPFGIAVAFPMLGVSVNRLSESELRRSEQMSLGACDAGLKSCATRQQLLRVRSFDATTLGVSLVQSLGDRFVVGGTLKLLRGSAAADTLPAATQAGDAFDHAATLDQQGRTVADADIGGLAFAGPVRVGVMVRNVGDHQFDTGVAGEDPFRLQRHVRIGAAVGPGPAWTRRGWTVAVDADLTTVEAADGDRRTLAVGGERWIGQAKRFALRGGARVQTVGDPRPEATAGASVAVRTGVYAEGQVSAGGERATSGWSLSARLTF